MELLRAQLEVYKDAKKPHEIAKRALLTMFQDACTLNDKIQRILKDKETLEEFMGKCIRGSRPRILKDANDLSKEYAIIDAALEKAKAEEETRLKRKAKRDAAAAASTVPAINITVVVGGGEVIVRNTGKAVESEDPIAPTKRVKKTPIPKCIKDASWAKYVGNECAKTKCLCCDRTDILMNSFVAGHIISEKNHGKVTVDNIIPICNGCNSSMGIRNMHEFCETHWNRKLVLPK